MQDKRERPGSLPAFLLCLRQTPRKGDGSTHRSLGDLHGPKLRLGTFVDGRAQLTTGEKFELNLPGGPGTQQPVSFALSRDLSRSLAGRAASSLLCAIELRFECCVANSNPEACPIFCEMGVMYRTWPVLRSLQGSRQTSG